jgi:hypothetical protein
VRQSWLDTAFNCPERGRLDIASPVREEGDAAACGTASHAAVEQFLLGNISLDQIEHYARQHAQRMADEGVRQDDGSVIQLAYKSLDGPNDLIYHAGNCARGWIEDVWPYIHAKWGDTAVGGGLCEAKFEFDAFMYRDWLVKFQGTVDYVPPWGNELMDFKFPGRDYKQKEKQQQAVQPTVYTAAAVAGCFARQDDAAEPFTWPVTFTYGIGLRLKTKSRGQLVQVQRTQGHVDWLYRRVRTFVNLYLDLGLDAEWPTNEAYVLCSDKWCSWYRDCRGAHVSRDMDLYGWQQAA